MRASSKCCEWLEVSLDSPVASRDTAVVCSDYGAQLKLASMGQ